MNLGQQQPSNVVRIEQYVKSLEQNTSNVLLNEDVNKLNFIRTTPFSADQWENYFDMTACKISWWLYKRSRDIRNL